MCVRTELERNVNIVIRKQFGGQYTITALSCTRNTVHKKKKKMFTPTARVCKNNFEELRLKKPNVGQVCKKKKMR